MMRSHDSKRALSALLLLALGCASIGSDAAFPDPVQTSGVGPFRLLTSTETGLSEDAAPPGSALPLAEGEVSDGGMVAGGRLYYASAAPLADPPERDASLAAYQVDWARYEARVIRAAAGRTDGVGFDAGEVVLEASEAWEGDAVFDPWVVVLEDGTRRLYYAAEEGIGIAEAGAEGAFARVAGPVFLGRGPSVVRTADDAGFLMFFERDGELRVASSLDGVAFLPDEPVDFLATEEMFDAPELTHHRPGAAWGTMPSGRRTLRLYFETRLEDGTQLPTVAASLDGESFERRIASVFAGEVPAGAPAPWVRSEEITLMVFSYVPGFEDMEEGADPIRQLALGIAPAHLNVEPSQD